MLFNAINQIEPGAKSGWGQKSADQMLAHCNVSYEMFYEDKHPKPGFVMKLILKSFVKNKMVSEVPYGRNWRTAPVFLIKERKNFEVERNRLIGYIARTQELGENKFDNSEFLSFVKLSKTEWNNMFYKHLDHHLTQFGF